MNIKRIIKEEIDDFSWVNENPIEVGKCFTLKSNTQGDILIKVSKIVPPKNIDKLNHLTTLNQTKVHFNMYSGYYSRDWHLSYSQVENRVNTSDMIPCDCPTVKESKNKLIKESGVENYLQSIADITSGGQKIYYDWIINNLEKVPINSYKSNEKLRNTIDSFIKKMRRFGNFCQKKGCFDTAYNIAMHVPDVHYIEGYVQSIIPLIHAWNYLPEEGIYFDLINDIAWEEEDSHFNEYYKVIDLDKNGVLKWSSKTGYGGGFMESPQFIESIVNKENINESFSDEWDWTKGEVYSVGQIIELGSDTILEVGQTIYLTGEFWKSNPSPYSGDTLPDFIDLENEPVVVVRTRRKDSPFRVSIKGNKRLQNFLDKTGETILGTVKKDDNIMVTF